MNCLNYITAILSELYFMYTPAKEICMTDCLMFKCFIDFQIVYFNVLNVKSTQRVLKTRDKPFRHER